MNQTPPWQAEVSITTQLVKSLLDEQFPDFKEHVVKPAGEGWDNAVYQVGDTLFRFPRRARAVAGVMRQAFVLPLLRQHLPSHIALPMATHKGVPTKDYPWPFLAYRRVEGTQLCDTPLDAASRLQLAAALAGFLRALHTLPASPPVAAHLGDAAQLDAVMLRGKGLEVLSRLRGVAPGDAAKAEALLRGGVSLKQPTAVICHGDLHFRHLLMRQGQLAGIIDWDDMLLADPARDLHNYWSLFDPPQRRVFLATYGEVSLAQLDLARVLAVYLMVVLADYAQVKDLKSVLTEAHDGLRRACLDG